ncbi:MAG: hypothetical protein ACM31L_19415 [Actinomycetota bacterium]
MERLRKDFELRARLIKVRTRGRIGEVIAGLAFPLDIRDRVEIDRRTFQTPFGLRRVDNFMAETGEAVESKMTRVTAGRRIRAQIAKDAWLLREGLVRRVLWILYKGGSVRLKALLAENGIEIIDGWENLGKPAPTDTIS